METVPVQSCVWLRFLEKKKGNHEPECSHVILKHTTTKTQKHHHKNTKTPPQKTTTPPQKHNHKITKTPPQKTTTPPQKHNHKITETPPQKHNHTTTKTQPQKHNYATTKTQPQKHPHHHRNTTTPPAFCARLPAFFITLKGDNRRFPASFSYKAIFTILRCFRHFSNASQNAVPATTLDTTQCLGSADMTSHQNSH